MVRVLVLAASAALLAPSPSGASIWIANRAGSPSLHVDARGNAEVDWTDEHGVKRTLVVPPHGQVFHGHAGADVSRATAVVLPLALVVRRTADGKLWALQQWPVSGRLELHLSRWTGAPTKVTAQVAGNRLTGNVTFHGAPVFGLSPTPAGKQLHVAAYIDALQGTTWNELLSLHPKAPDGSFSLSIQPAWQATRYRVTVYGQNRGWVLEPDAFVEAGA